MKILTWVAQVQKFLIARQLGQHNLHLFGDQCGPTLRHIGRRETISWEDPCDWQHFKEVPIRSYGSVHLEMVACTYLHLLFSF